MAKHNAPPAAPPPEMALVVVDEPVNHDGDAYAPGEELLCTVDQAAALMAMGAAHAPEAASSEQPQA